jgi:hypothetical protein
MKKERITEYLKYKGYKSAKSFALVLGISDSHITEADSRKENRALIDALRSKSEFSDLNLEWFKLGVGEMIVGTVAAPEFIYRPTRIIQDLTPSEYEMIRIARGCPEAVAVVRMMGAVDPNTQKDIQRGAEKEKLMYDLMKERQEKKSA